MKKTRRTSSIRLTATLAVFSAIGIVLGKLLAFNITEFMRFSLENLTIILAGILFGPICGAAVGIVQDLVGCLLVGYAINPIITLGCAATGCVAGIITRSAKERTSVPSVLLSVFGAHLIGSVIIKSAGLALFYSLPFGVTIAWRTLNYIVVGTAESVILISLSKSKQLLSFIKKGGVNNDL